MYLQVLLFRHSARNCKNDVMPTFHMHTGQWVLAEIIIFYLYFVFSCCVGCLAACKNVVHTH